jgi:phage terminase large subunit
MSVTITTALRKISSLKKRIWGLQGGQGAGKTYSVLTLMINHAIKHPNKEIYIASAELSKMRDTVIKDAINILRAFNKYKEVQCTGISFGQPRIDFPNGSFIRFLGLDKEDVGKGLRSDIMFVNEANKVNFETYRELTSRAKKIIIDFNPNESFWFHKEVANREDCNFLILTFLDNEYLSKEEVLEILNYKKNGYLNTDLEDYDLPSNVKSEYWANKWRIYGLGQIGGVEGRIFFWKPINYYEFVKINAPSIYTVDWGKQDPFAIGEMKYFDGQLINHELNYKSENEWFAKLTSSELAQITGRDGDGFVTWMFDRLDIPKNAVIVCDSNRPEKIKSLRRAGWEYAVAVDGSSKKILDGIDLLHNLDVYYTDTSQNIEFEQKVYCWDTDKNDNPLEKPKDLNNHHIDRIRYGAMYWQKKGIIRKL